METIQSRSGQGRVADAPSRHWVYRLLPRGLWPYAQLARWDRPIGWQLLLWPCWWSAALAASAYARPGDTLASLLPSPWVLFLFLAGAIAMRGVLIAAGAALVHQFHWLLYGFGAFLLYTAWKMAFGPEHPPDPGQSRIVRAVRRASMS